MSEARQGRAPVKTVFGPADWSGDPGQPGEWPFTRGIHPTMYTAKLWTMRQYAGFGTAEDTNDRFRMLLAAGQTGLSVAFDLPTQMGFDSDHSMAAGEVGRVGVAVDSVEDLAVLFRDIPLDRVSTSMTINATAAILLAMYVVVAEEHGIPKIKLAGTVQNDLLKEYIARGTYIFPPEPSLRLAVDVMRFVASESMNFNPISISGYHIREAGATAIQEVGFTLANGLEYCRRAIAIGLPIERFGPRLSFFFAAHNDLFEEVAKFRAARRLWAKLARDRLRADDQTCRMRFHTQTGGVTLQAQQPINNVVRVTIQALAATMGGTQSLHTNGYDEALALPSPEAATLALRTQQVIGYESGVARVVDPLGGSYYIEHLTDRIEAGALELIDAIDEKGGAVAAVESGYYQEAIAASAYAFQQGVESGQITIVGVNKFATGEPPAAPPQPDFSALEGKQRATVAGVRAARDGTLAATRVAAVAEAARGSGPVMPAIVDAVRARATLGEISDALRNVWGVYRP